VDDSFTGLGIAQLAFGALGVLAIIRVHHRVDPHTFASVPRRRAYRRPGAVVGVVSLRAGS
jgi:hypothetical protein